MHVNYKHYEVFDFLRGLAIFLVFINHIPHNEYLINDETPYLIKKIFLFGTYGVQLFYIVSALTLMLSLTRRGDIDFKKFYLRRFFRIVPLFYVGICIHIIYFNTYSDVYENIINVKNIFLNIFFINNVIPPSNDLIFGGSTIATEMNFYLILPFLYLALNNYKKVLIFTISYLSFLIIINFFSSEIFNFKKFGDVNFYRTIFVQLYVFSLGLLLFHTHKNLILNNFNNASINYKDIIIKCLPILLLSVLIFFTSKQNPEYFYFKNMFLVSNFFYLFINCLLIFYHKIKSNLIYIFFTRLGKISFSMYIIHWITIHFCWIIALKFELFNNFLVFFIIYSFVITYICSYIFSKLEYFFIRIGKKLTI